MSPTSPTRRLDPAAIPWFAVIIPAAYVLNLWVESGVSVLAVVRSLLIVVFAATALTGAVSLMTRRPGLAGVVTIVAFALLVSRGPIYAIGVVVIVAAVSALVLVWSRIQRAAPSWRATARALNVLSLAVLVVIAVGGVTGGTFAAVPDDIIDQGAPRLEPASARERADGPPDIYVILLDGYPRTDFLASLFGGDNSSFLSGLRTRGFDVADASSSNYMFTELTLTSMLNMTPVPEIQGIGEVISGEVTDHPRLRRALNHNGVFAFLRGHGYRVVSSSPGYEHVALRGTDVALDGGQLNDFEYHLVRYTALQWVVNRAAPDFFGDQQRARIRSGLSAIPEILGDTGGSPTFAFLHLPAPHPPIVFDRGGGRADPPRSGDIYQQAHRLSDLNAEAYVEQVEFLDDAVLEAIDDGLRARGSAADPVILVMSDHGAAPRPEVFQGQGGPEHYANLFAAFTPGRDTLFAEDISPINVFPTLFNAYFGTELPLLANGTYRWDSTTGTDGP
jgi:hypothetical protein